MEKGRGRGAWVLRGVMVVLGAFQNLRGKVPDCRNADAMKAITTDACLSEARKRACCFLALSSGEEWR